jgi:hypothetical protein
MLEVKQLALYWNSNVVDDLLTKSKDFSKLPAQKLIEMSKRYVENLKQKYASMV